MKKKSEYVKKLMDPRWQKKRLEILQRDNFTCQDCGETEQTLHVHHRLYEYGKNPWEYDNSILVTLCAECHSIETESMPQYIKVLVGELKTVFLCGEVDSFGWAIKMYSHTSSYNPKDRMRILCYLMEYHAKEIESLYESIKGVVPK